MVVVRFVVETIRIRSAQIDLDIEQFIAEKEMDLLELVLFAANLYVK